MKVYFVMCSIFSKAEIVTAKIIIYSQGKILLKLFQKIIYPIKENESPIENDEKIYK